MGVQVSDAENKRENESAFSRRLSWGGTLLVWLAVLLPFFFLYVVSRRAVINEVRLHAMGVAIATASGIDTELLPEIRSAEDMGTPGFEKIQRYLSRQIESNPDIRFIYTMRRATGPNASPSAYEFVVDGPARDFDGDGKIGPDEASEDPGAPYDATDLPALIEAWDRPSADPDISPDPPYPDLISGYAPIRGANDVTLGIVGVDITARTVAMKLRMVQIVIFCVWLLICVLITLIIHLYYQQNAAFEEIRRLNDELAARHELLRRTSRELSARDTQRLDLDFAPPRARTVFDRFDLRAAHIGGAPAGVFEVDQDRVAFYLASIPYASGNASMIASLISVALNALAEGTGGAPGVPSVYVDLSDPGAVLRRLSALIANDLPPEESISLLYGVINLNDDSIALAAAGSCFAALCRRASGAVESVELVAGAPLRSGDTNEYRVATLRLNEGERILMVAADDARAVFAGAADRVKGEPLKEEIARVAALFPAGRANLLAIEAC